MAVLAVNLQGPKLMHMPGLLSDAKSQGPPQTKTGKHIAARYMVQRPRMLKSCPLNFMQVMSGQGE